MKILFITDSLGLPRNEPEVVNFEETYIQLIRKRENWDVYSFSKGGATLKELSEINSFHGNFLNQPDVVVIQSGIVDCAPRAFKAFESKVLSGLNLFRFIPRRLISLLRKKRKITYLSIEKFSYALKKIKKHYPSSLFLCLEILPASIEYECKIKGVSENIKLYNKILYQSGMNIIPTSDFDSSFIMTDHHHLNKFGHEKLAEIITTSILRLEN